MTTGNLDLAKSFEADASAWVHWEEGDFDVHVKYLSLGAAEKLIKDCQVNIFDPKTHLRSEKVDDDKFKKKIADLIVDWKGLTAKKAKRFVNLKKDIADDSEFPCIPTAKLFAIAEFSNFPSFILDTAKDLHRKKEEEQEVEEKN